MHYPRKGKEMNCHRNKVHKIAVTNVQRTWKKGLTIPETPLNNTGCLLPSLSTTRTAVPVITNYNNKRN